jgi:predicted amino acid-binding ACT domain protein
MQPISLLVTVAGRDRPGVTAVIFAALAAHDVDVRDVVQTVSDRQARLAILVDLRGDPAALRHSVNSTAQAFGVESQVITAGPDAHVVHSVPRSRSRAGRSRAVAVGTRLRAGTLGDIAKRVVDVGGNIESMWQSSDDTFTGVEMSLDGESSRLRPALIASVGETGLDLAVGPAGARTRGRRLLVLDADAVLGASGSFPRVAGFVGAARQAGCSIAAVGRRRPSDRADLGLDAVVAMDDADATLRGLATDLDLPPSRIVVVGDPQDSARLLAAASTAIEVDTHAAADVPGEPGFLDSALYLLARI